MKIILKIIHESDDGKQHTKHEEDISEILNNANTKILAKAFELASLVSNQED